MVKFNCFMPLFGQNYIFRPSIPFDEKLIFSLNYVKIQLLYAFICFNMRKTGLCLIK